MADETGKALFVDNCSGCHQLEGAGQAGLAPPLTDTALWSGLGPLSSDYIAGVMIGGLTGTITAGGQKFIGLAMPPQDWMTDEELKAVADYVLHDLNGLALEVSDETLAAARQSPPSHADLRAIRKEAIQ
ncbi:cytochrome c [uncultured Stenotrophomonas sp.]|uniref:c-type cytochrome n=1 Tax=uncultured Stenotrophomonas sp. TaxID=165438 RepID=UPI00258BAEDB|nr:cytochrome c [uncultured Stenotrophomonas sp.]